MEVANPVIKLINDSNKGLEELNIFLDSNDNESMLIRDYPTVYIHNWKSNDKYEVYVGESNNFFERTQQHFDVGSKRDVWQKNIKNKDVKLYVIAHPEFNKSLTLDVENRLIHYLSGCNSVKKVHNARGNPQGKYYPSEDFDKIFSKIWNKLRNSNKELFLSEWQIKDSAIFKASPLHKLTNKQLEAKEQICNTINECLIKDSKNQLVFVQGEAGTGKTVLMSSIFYEYLDKAKYDVDFNKTICNNLECAVVVNHAEQLGVYTEIINKLDLKKNNEEIVYNPTTLINLFKNKKNSPKKRDKMFDIIFVDEAHLLLTQNNQSFTDKNQLNELLKYSKVVVAMFDKKQILSSEQYKDDESIYNYINMAKRNNSFIELSEQLRMNCSKEVYKWIKSIVNDGKVDILSKQRGKYEVKLFDSPLKLENAIKSKANNEKYNLSRMVATYDWPYNLNKRCKSDDYWSVKINYDNGKEWKKPWNGEYLRNMDSKEKKLIKGLAWAEQPQTIDEIGSTFTIQGFDLNYVGVIIGPSVTYRDGKIKINPSASSNRKAKNCRTLDDGSKISLADELIKNELGVLLTRGVNGLYIYACDEELRNRLKECVK